MRVLVVALMMSAMAFAGCAEDSAPPTQDEFQEAFQEEKIVVTSTTGAIRGVVVDNAVVPVAGAVVTLQGQGVNASTNVNGAFVFSELEPGTYFMNVAKTGYNSTQVSTEVVAGVANPPVVKIQIAIAPGTEPYAVASQYAGFLACGFAVFATSIGCTILADIGTLTNSVSIWRHQFDSPSIKWTQGELVWEQTQPAGGMFIWEITGRNNNHIGYRETGESPALAYINQETFEANPRDIQTAGIDYRFFGGPHPLCHGIWGFGCGVTLDQAADAYVHDFYNFVPEEGWRYTSDGDPVIPS